MLANLNIAYFIGRGAAPGPLLGSQGESMGLRLGAQGPPKKYSATTCRLNIYLDVLLAATWSPNGPLPALVRPGFSSLGPFPVSCTALGHLSIVGIGNDVLTCIAYNYIWATCEYTYQLIISKLRHNFYNISCIVYSMHA